MVRCIILAVLAVTIVGKMAFSDTAKLLIVAGQSNASGRASFVGLPNDLILQDDVLYMYETDRGFSQFTFRELRILASSFGPELLLGRTVADAVNDQVAIVKVAFGGTTLAALAGQDWNVNSPGELYDKLLNNINMAESTLAADGMDVEFGGLFWMQGESDAKSGNLGGGESPPPQPDTANAYEANLNAFITTLRTDLGEPNLPAFIGQINIGDDPSIVTNPDSNYNTSFGEWDFTPTIQAAQAAVAANDPHAQLIDTSTFSLSNDYLHFDQAGQIALGTAFGNAYLATIPEPTVSSLPSLLMLTLALRIRCRPRPELGQQDQTYQLKNS